MYNKVNNVLVQMIKDLEDTREIYHGYSYVRTMRNILVGNKQAAIAPFFKDKIYYGKIRSLKLEELERILDKMVKEKQIYILLTEHGKLYCTHDYHEYMCKKEKWK